MYYYLKLSDKAHKWIVIATRFKYQDSAQYEISDKKLIQFLFGKEGQSSPVVLTIPPDK